MTKDGTKERHKKRKKEKRFVDVDNYMINIQGRKIMERNRIRYTLTKQGDTFAGLAAEFALMEWQILKYNELTKDSILKEGQIIYIQPKRSKAEHGKDFHIIAKGETMYKISQEYGIKLKKLLAKNNMKQGDEPQGGTKLFLRKRKSVTE
ncbi:MAG: LysM peptidoglycan-binding domain-containing protein [Bacteroidia bacterium]|nr:LysM peptidoglycan-binding domain-containing protein [Bacteroidia bacterium]